MSMENQIDQKESDSPFNQSIADQQIKDMKKPQSHSSGYTKWTRQQDVLYVRFLKANVERMKKTEFRKPYNKFKRMSEYVTSKDSFQCRSHHQKMMKKFGTIEEIVENLSILRQKSPKPGSKVSKNSPNESIPEKLCNILKSSSSKSCKNIDNIKLNKQAQQIKIQNQFVQIKAQQLQHEKTSKPLDNMSNLFYSEPQKNKILPQNQQLNMNPKIQTQFQFYQRITQRKQHLQNQFQTHTQKSQNQSEINNHYRFPLLQNRLPQYFLQPKFNFHSPFHQYWPMAFPQNYSNWPYYPSPYFQQLNSFQRINNRLDNKFNDKRSNKKASRKKQTIKQK